MELPSGLWMKGEVRDVARGELLKDIAAMHNGLLVAGLEVARIVYGAKDLGGARRVVGIGRSLDDADLQSWAASVFHCSPPISYGAYPTLSGALLGIVTVQRGVEPTIPKRNVGPLSEGQVWIRQGTQNRVAGPEVLKLLFEPPKPFRIGNLNDPVVTTLAEHFRESGDELVFKRYTDKDALLTRGWRVAQFPGTHRDIQVVDHSGRIELAGMLKPRQ
jgi:hypothetical protein